MIEIPAMLAVLILVQTTPATDSLRHTLTPDELKIYTLTIRDVVSSLEPSLPSGELPIALDPILRRGPGPLPNPWSGIHFAIPSLGALLEASGIKRFCDPADWNACRGSALGRVL